MKQSYLTPDDSDAFVDFPPPLEHLHHPYTGKLPEGHVLCAKCKGHGGWNLTLNSYPRPAEQVRKLMLEGKLTLSEYRHKYVHFKASCSNCNGWGYVSEKQGTHIHEWLRDRNVGNCLNVYRCKTCGEEQTVDSTD